MITSTCVFKKALLYQLTDLQQQCMDIKKIWLEKRITEVSNMAEQDITKRVFMEILRECIIL